MQTHHCRCGQLVYCENSLCGRCGCTLAFEPLTGEMLSLDLQPDGVLTDAGGKSYRLCANWAAHRACNGVIEAPSGSQVVGITATQVSGGPGTIEMAGCSGSVWKL